MVCVNIAKNVRNTDLLLQTNNASNIVKNDLPKTSQFVEKSW